MSNEIEIADKGLANARGQINMLIARVPRMKSAEVLDAVASASKLRDWLKITEAAADVRKQAVLLELHLLRRCWEVGAYGSLPQGRKGVCRRLGNMTEAEFSDFCMRVTEWATPHSMFRRMDDEAREQRDQKDVSAAIRGQRVTPRSDRFHDVDVDKAWKSAAGLMEQLAGEEEPFTIASAAERLGSALYEASGGDFGDPQSGSWQRDHMIRQGLEDLVSEAVRNADRPLDPVILESGASVRPPKFVTYKDEETGKVWLRIPWERSTVGQFRAMVELRQHQAQQVAQRAAQLTEILQMLEEQQPADGDAASCSKLLSALEGADPVTS